MRLISFLFLALALWACEPKKQNVETTDTETSRPDVVNTNFDYQVGKKMYVHASAGLSLRKAPDAKAEKVGLAKWGEALEIVALPAPEHSYIAETIGDFQLKGYWVKVKNDEGKEAYAFDGYLLSFPVCAEEPEENIEIMEGCYGVKSKFKGERQVMSPNREKGIVEGYKQAYEDGAVFEFIFYEGGVTSLLTVPSSSLSMQQALVSMRALQFYNVKKLKQEYDEKAKAVRVSDAENGYTWLEVSEKDGNVIIGYYSAD